MMIGVGAAFDFHAGVVSRGRSKAALSLTLSLTLSQGARG
jgi:hypothetical protein